MASIIRSRSKKRSRSAKYAGVFKAVEDSRTNRLSSKLQSIPSCPEYVKKISGGDVVMDLADQAPLVKTGHRKKAVGFNLYGSGKREMRF